MHQPVHTAVREGVSDVAIGTDEIYDVVILGGGIGGYACAFRAAELGLAVALV